MHFPFFLSLKEAEKKKNAPIDESTVVDDVFGYLEDEDSRGIQQEPSAFKDLPAKRRRKSEAVMGVPLAPDDDEDLSEFSFQKFAKTYFHGNVTHQYSRRLIRQSLLPLSANGDKAVRNLHVNH